MSSNDPHIARLEFRELRIPFTVAFRHAAAERAETSSVWIEAIASDGIVGCGESCPRPYVTGETLATARTFMSKHEAELRRTVTGVETLLAWVAAHQNGINTGPAAWCAIELAILDLLGKRHRAPVERP